MFNLKRWEVFFSKWVFFSKQAWLLLTEPAIAVFTHLHNECTRRSCDDIYCVCVCAMQTSAPRWAQRGAWFCALLSNFKKLLDLVQYKKKQDVQKRWEKKCADGVIRKMEGKLIFTLSQFCVLWDTTQETYWILEEKKSQKREISNTSGLLGISVLKMCTFPSSPAPPTGLCFLAPYHVAHNLIYAFSVKTAFLWLHDSSTLTTLSVSRRRQDTTSQLT